MNKTTKDNSIRKNKETVNISFEIEYDEIEWNGDWIPKTVYKYRDWNNESHKKVLTESSLWLPDSFAFNDPFDCNIPVAYEILGTDEGVAKTFFKNLVYGNKNIAPEHKENNVTQFLKDAKFKDVSYIENHKQEMLKSMREKKGVLCVTPINNNILMWSHYANSHNGFCVGYDSAKLFQFLGGGGKVNYSSTYPIISPIEDLHQQHFYQFNTKSIHWAYEIEYRLNTFNKTNTIIKLPSDTIAEVILGARMAENDKDQIKKLLREQHQHVAIFQAIPEKNDFSLRIEKI